MIPDGMYKTPGGKIVPVEILLAALIFEKTRVGIQTKAGDAAADYTAAEFVAKKIRRTGTLGGATTDTIPDASTIITLMEALGPWPVGSSFELEIHNVGTGQTITMDDSSDTNWTLTGTMTIATNTGKRFLVSRTGAATLTLLGLGAGGTI